MGSLIVLPQVATRMRYYTLQEHQTILTNVTLSENSDLVFAIVVNEEFCFQVFDERK